MAWAAPEQAVTGDGILTGELDMSLDEPTARELLALLDEIHDEAAAALAQESPALFEKALDNIAAMARYRFDPTASHDRVRNRST